MRPLTVGQKKQIKESLYWKWTNKRIKPLTPKQEVWVRLMLGSYDDKKRHATDQHCSLLLESQMTVGIQLVPNKRLMALLNLKKSDLKKYLGVYHIKRSYEYN